MYFYYLSCSNFSSVQILIYLGIVATPAVHNVTIQPNIFYNGETSFLWHKNNYMLLKNVNIIIKICRLNDNIPSLRKVGKK